MRIFFIGLALCLTLISVPSLSSAAACVPNPATGLQCPLDESLVSGPQFFVDLINKVSNWLFTFLLVIAVAFIVIAAYNYLFSQGSEEAVSAAHKMLLYAAVAIAVAMLSRGFVFVVRSLITGSTGPSASTTPPESSPSSPTTNPAATPTQVLYSPIAAITDMQVSVELCADNTVPAVRRINSDGTSLTFGTPNGAMVKIATIGGIGPDTITFWAQACADATVGTPRMLINGQQFGE